MTDREQHTTDRGRFGLIATIGCGLTVVLIALIAAPLLVGPGTLSRIGEQLQADETGPTAPAAEAQPTLTAAPATEGQSVVGELEVASFVGLYEELAPSVVSIQVFVDQRGVAGQGAGSGFVLDREGHIITNSHVVAQADLISVVFYNGIEVEAALVGTDPFSDLAVLQVDWLPPEARPLPLADSESVEVGEWVIAIGNPFGQQSSMTVGIVSAVGRTIPTGATPFSIPQAIQTDAAINPGNSGGPLMNLAGQVIGVNAQIATGGTPANAGVGFAIPADIVRMVAPALIDSGSYPWPFLGVVGADLSLLIRQANELELRQGAYIQSVDPSGPAAQAGVQGSTGTQIVQGVEVPVGGDVVTAIDGEPVLNFSDLLVEIAFRRPGDQVELTVLRDGSEQQISVTLVARQ